MGFSEISRSKNKWIHVLINLGLVMVFALISIILCEILTRFYFPRFNPNGQFTMVIHESKKYIIGKPGFKGRQLNTFGEFDVSVEINSEGFRDKKSTQEMKNEDMLVVGDSYCFGWGVEEEQRFSNQLQNNLGKKVFNVCMPNYLDGYFYLIKDLSKLRKKFPATIILTVCMENDISMYSDELSTVETQMQSLKRGMLANIKLWLTGHSAFYVGLVTQIKNFLPLRRLLKKFGLIVDVLDVTSNSYFEQRVKSSLDQVEKIKNFVPGSRVFVLLVPQRTIWIGPTMSAEKKTYQEFLSGLESMDIIVVDPIRDFEKSGYPLQYYYKEDPHWNNKGHAAAAGLLGKAMANQGLQLE